MPTPLQQYLQLLEDDLDDSKTTVGTQAGPLPAGDRSIVAADLASAQQHIRDALTAINDTGTADSNNLPTTLPGISVECYALARDAHYESIQTNPNNTAIGNKIKTVNRIIDVANGYKDKAGIT